MIISNYTANFISYLVSPNDHRDDMGVDGPRADMVVKG